MPQSGTDRLQAVLHLRASSHSSLPSGFHTLLQPSKGPWLLLLRHEVSQETAEDLGSITVPTIETFHPVFPGARESPGSHAP